MSQRPGQRAILDENAKTKYKQMREKRNLRKKLQMSDLSHETITSSSRKNSTSSSSSDFISTYSSDGDTIHETQSQSVPFVEKVLNTEEIVDQMNKRINEISSVLNLPSMITRILLSHFNWDELVLKEKYFSEDDNDSGNFFQEVHVINPHQINKPDNPAAHSIAECKICLNTADIVGLQCGHQFCKCCWNTYLSTKINGSFLGDNIKMTCAEQDCDIIVDDATVTNLITAPEVILRYNRLITETFVQWKPNLRWCPSPGCNYAIDVHLSNRVFVTCQCGHRFCFRCDGNVDWHPPVLCEYLKKWNSMTAHISIHTKTCPKCNANIEKNGGCNHMLCRCGHDFCWMCLRKWTHHLNDNKCNRFVEATDEIKRPKSSSARLNYYWQRYDSHRQSLKLEEDYYSSTDMVKKWSHWNEKDLLHYLKEGVEVLLTCRQALMYSYIFVYYLEEDNNSDIFQTNQADLETATEALAEYLQHDTCKDSSEDLILSIIEKVLNKYTYCEKRRKTLLDHVKESYDDDVWKHRE